jgi:hypothetical protein
MLESRRTMVWRVCLGSMAFVVIGDHGAVVPDSNGGVAVQVVERHELVGGVGLGDVAGAVDDVR